MFRTSLDRGRRQLCSATCIIKYCALCRVLWRLKSSSSNPCIVCSCGPRRVRPPRPTWLSIPCKQSGTVAAVKTIQTDVTAPLHTRTEIYKAAALLDRFAIAMLPRHVGSDPSRPPSACVSSLCPAPP
ncbi:hypothetical protein HaLaN_05118 [Haematococcus lacustris]|uniref:Uncharacterized protein n=1 Tax=Haematococcus lacustris TaxID=44745 RepID=A0A699YII1_HAELA|nr:hypothetical protein HaLaN_05118 [Haematococcus lacustris]